MSIYDLTEKIKAFITGERARDMAIIAIVGIVGIGSFFLGRWSNKDSQPIYAEQTSPKDTVKFEITSQPDQKLAPENNTQKTEQGTATGSFLASKNGTKYYPKGCSSIDRIKPENLIGFETEAEAQASGRIKSSVCK